MRAMHCMIPRTAGLLNVDVLESSGGPNRVAGKAQERPTQRPRGSNVYSLLPSNQSAQPPKIASATGVPMVALAPAAGEFLPIGLSSTRRHLVPLGPLGS